MKPCPLIDLRLEAGSGDYFLGLYNFYQENKMGQKNFLDFFLDKKFRKSCLFSLLS